MKVLGIDVAPELIDRWVDWWMPETHPFVVPAALAAERSWPDARTGVPMDVGDAFEIYALALDESIVCLDRRQARGLPAEIRRRQPTRHLWRSGDADVDRRRAIARVEDGRRPSRHAEVTGAEWDASASVVPGARAVAGTFPERSGPNCFGAVMAAAGVAGAESEWMQIEPFEDWLHARTTPGGDDDTAGTVMVWRGRNGAPAHAGITLGGGWYLHKPSQGWMSPTKVLAVRDGKYSSRHPGLRLHRYILVQP